MTSMDSIESYIQRLPITSEFRQEHPNLQPMATGSQFRTAPLPRLDDETRSMVSQTPSAHSMVSQSPSTMSMSTLASSTKTRLKRMSINLRRRSTVEMPEPGNTPFWKYHVLKFGGNMYLTTNPELKHVYCRHAPGYYVEVKRTSGGGYVMTFQDGAHEHVLMTVERRPSNEGGHLTISMARASRVVGLEVKRRPVPQAPVDEAPTLGVAVRSTAGRFNGLAIPQKLDQRVVPVIGEPVHFKTFVFKDFRNITWDVGHIPRTRPSRMRDVLRLVGKRNVYFHQNFVNNHDTLTGPFPPVVAAWRPCETKTRKKLVSSIRHLNAHDRRLLAQSIDNDIGAGARVKTYFTAGDGLYYDRNPQDDAPDDNKLGWLTIYEDASLGQRGMFDLVVGLTLAVAYEQMS